MNWADELQSWGVALLLAFVIYVVGDYLFRSLHPTGALNWQAQRWRKGVALLVLLTAGIFDVRFNFQRGHIRLFAAVALWCVIGFLTLLLLWWWWRDARKEKAYRATLIEKLYTEGRKPPLPPMSTGKKVWRWTVNGYAVFLIGAGLYALVRYVIMKF